MLGKHACQLRTVSLFLFGFDKNEEIEMEKIIFSPAPDKVFARALIARFDPLFSDILPPRSLILIRANPKDRNFEKKVKDLLWQCPQNSKIRIIFLNCESGNDLQFTHVVNECGRGDVNYLSRVTEKSNADLLRSVNNLIYLDPGGMPQGDSDRVLFRSRGQVVMPQKWVEPISKDLEDASTEFQCLNYPLFFHDILVPLYELASQSLEGIVSADMLRRKFAVLDPERIWIHSLPKILCERKILGQIGENMYVVPFSNAKPSFNLDQVWNVGGYSSIEGRRVKFSDPGRSFSLSILVQLFRELKKTLKTTLQIAWREGVVFSTVTGIWCSLHLHGPMGEEPQCFDILVAGPTEQIVKEVLSIVVPFMKEKVGGVDIFFLLPSAVVRYFSVRKKMYITSLFLDEEADSPLQTALEKASGFTPTHRAIHDGILEDLRESKTIPDVLSDLNHPGLFLACQNNHPVVLKYLLATGPYQNFFVPWKGITPSGIAQEESYTDIKMIISQYKKNPSDTRQKYRKFFGLEKGHPLSLPLLAFPNIHVFFSCR